MYQSIHPRATTPNLLLGFLLPGLIAHAVRDEQVFPEEILSEIVEALVLGAEAVSGRDARDAGEFVHVLLVLVTTSVRRCEDGIMWCASSGAVACGPQGKGGKTYDQGPRAREQGVIFPVDEHHAGYYAHVMLPPMA